MSNSYIYIKNLLKHYLFEYISIEYNRFLCYISSYKPHWKGFSSHYQTMKTQYIFNDKFEHPEYSSNDKYSAETRNECNSQGRALSRRAYSPVQSIIPARDKGGSWNECTLATPKASLIPRSSPRRIPFE